METTGTKHVVARTLTRNVQTTLNEDGSFDVTFEFNIENFGNVNLSDLELEDDLEATFDVTDGCMDIDVVSLTSDDFVVNQGYNGTGNNNLLAARNDLPVGDKGAVLLTVNVSSCGSETNFENTSEVTATTPTDTEISDISDNGSDPRPAGERPTPISITPNPIIGASKRVSQGPTSNEDGTYDVTFEIKVQNYGNINLDNLQVEEDLATTFADADAWEVLSVESEEFNVNVGFDGDADPNLLVVDGNDILTVGNEGVIYVQVRVTPGDDLRGYRNQVTASGEAPNRATTTDLSVDGSDPDPNGNGRPTENSPTRIDFEEDPGLVLTKRVSAGPSLDAEQWYVTTFELKLQNTGDIDLDNIQVEEDLEDAFGNATEWEIVSVESEEFDFNTAYDGITDINLLTGNDTLTSGNEGAIYVTVRVAPGCRETYRNRAVATADAPTGREQRSVAVVQDIMMPTFITVTCPVEGPIVQENDLGWCSAVVNFGEATGIAVAGLSPIRFEFRLTGVGASRELPDGSLEVVPNNQWIEGQPTGLKYDVGVTTVEIRAVANCNPDGSGARVVSEPCSFDVDVRDKEAPVLLCQDITVPVGDQCDYVLTPERIDAGATDNCTAQDDLVREIRLADGAYSTNSITFGRDDVLNSPITVYLRITDEAGNSSECTVEVNLEDRDDPVITCPEPMDIVAEDNFCAGKIPNLMEDLVIDNCAAIDTVLQNPRPGLLFGAAHNDFIDVVLTAIDINGNLDSCAVRLTLKDETPPEFLNCTRPDIRVNTLPGMCAAFVNFELPEAIDNCELDRIDQTDDTGLTTGDMFPVGTTILEYTAFDVAGNSTDCSFKVIVNDKAPPVIECPMSQTLVMDPGDCGGVVTGIAPVSVEDNCADNVAVTYKVENGGEIIEAGISDASGLFFLGGANVVTYRAQDQPLFLITEVTQDIGAADGGSNIPGFLTATNAADPNGDYLEVTNFGPAALNISCMTIQRLAEGGLIETLALPNGVTLPVGAVLTIHFGDGTDDPTNYFFNVPGASNLTPSQIAAYLVGHSGTVLDVAAVNGFNPTGMGDGFTVSANDWSGAPVDHDAAGIIRKYVWDSNSSEDFFTAAACDALSIGTLNPELMEDVFTDNGTTTSLQAQTPLMDECTFTITVEDNEAPECGMYGDAIVGMSGMLNEVIPAGECVDYMINITDDITIADVNVSVAGMTASMANLRMILISPEGTEIELWNQDCGANSGWDITFDADSLDLAIDNCTALNAGDEFRPVGDLEGLIGEASAGDWILRISNAAETADPVTLSNWEVEIRGQEVYEVPMLDANNDPGVCEAELTWTHPVFFDNCPGGQMFVEYIYESGNEDPTPLPVTNEVPRAKWGTEITRTFAVGTWRVIYTLKDAAGNEATCTEFTFTITDNEPPVVNTCPSDIVRNLGSGECEILLDAPTVDAMDNCGVESITFDPPFEMPFEIGTTTVTVTVTDVNGNKNTDCTFDVIVNGFEPDQVTMACFDVVNVTLDVNCEAVITPGMILSGNNYRCFDDYSLVLKYGKEPQDPFVPTSPVLTLDDVGRDIYVFVQDPVEGTICWGRVNVDHKRTPDFEIPADVELACNNIDTGDVRDIVITSCIDGTPTISFYDEIVENNGDCGEPYTLVIERTWRVTDSKGRFAEKVQTIRYKRFEVEDLLWPDNYVDETALSCVAVGADPSLLSPDSLGYPTLDNALPIFNNTDYCRFSFSYKDHRLEICEGSYEIIRTWTIRDLCEEFDDDNPVTHRQLIQVLDRNAPIFDCQENVTISTSPFDCMGDYTIPEPVLMDSCSSVTWDVSLGGAGSLIYDDESGVYTVYDLPVGTHTVTYRAVDDCGRRASCSYQLIVEDKVKPVVRCDDDLRVTLVEGDAKLIVNGYAFFTADEVDEGTTDNCSLDSLHIRRFIDDLNTQSDWEAVNDKALIDEYASDSPDYNQGYTGWDEIVEFFCPDLAGPVRVELRGMDSSGNTSICWMDVEVENGTNYNVNIQPEGDLQVTCDEVFNAEDHFNVSITGLACGASAISHTVIAELDQCGIGQYKIAFEVLGAESKNQATIVADTITVEVVAVHDYWIKFPADEVYECGSDQMRDTIEVSPITETACDLIAIATLPDQRFNVTDENPDACYKLLRTYQVINWCEYDGQSNPVIVSRDWDAPNAVGNTCNLNADGDTYDVGEYNLNPQEPDGDGMPGNSDLYVIVDINNATGRGMVYYDSDSDPSTGTATDNSATDDFVETYWWAVTREADCQDRSTWFDAGGVNEGSDAQDDNDNQYGSNGFWQYTQHIIVKDKTAPTAEIIMEPIAAISNVTCAVDSSFTVQITDECSLFDISVSATIDGVAYEDIVISGNPDSLLVATVSGQFSIGDHIVEITTRDGCGNTSVTTDTLVILDGKAPAPICKNGIVAELMPTENGDAMAVVWASDFIASPIGDCTGQGDNEVTIGGSDTQPEVIPAAYSIYIEDSVSVAGDTFYISPFANDSVRSVTLSCANLGGLSESVVNVRVYAEDGQGNNDFCRTFIRLQDNLGTCGNPAGTGMIAGLISSEDVVSIDDVEVQLSGAASTTYVTDDGGDYSFDRLVIGNDYTVTPSKDVDHKNGVSTLDLIIIQRHILGSQPITSPYQLIAADANNSRSVSTLDLIQIRKLILNLDTEFENNSSWRFVDESYIFPDRTNPWLGGFPEVRNVNNLDRIVLANFIGIKIGDVNGSAKMNEARAYQEVLEITTQELEMERGNTYTASFKADMSNIAGYQFTMDLDPSKVEIISVKEGIAKGENFGLFDQEGSITTSYHRDLNTTPELEGDVLFSITIRAKADAALSEVLSLSSRLTEAEGYNQNNELMAVGLSIDQGDPASEFDLYQNMPNPFGAETVIGFKLPEAMEGMLEFKDISGRTILLKEGSFTKGYNEVRLKANELPAAGVYFYSLHANQFTATKKMILLNR